jgi:hypothetical protein
MHKDGTNAPSRPAPVFTWLGPLAAFAEFGTEGYPRPVRRRLTIVNAMALLIAVFLVIYAAEFAYYDARAYHLIVVNLLLTVIMLLVPPRVLGEFPTADDETVIPLELVTSAVGRKVSTLDYEPVWGVDVARFGDDRTGTC